MEGRFLKVLPGTDRIFPLMVLFGLLGCGSQSSPAPSESNQQQRQQRQSASSSDSVPSSAGAAARGADYHVTPEATAGIEANGSWPHQAGPFLNSSTTETGLISTWLTETPPVQWSVEVGQGFSTPLVGTQEVYLFHRQGDEERIDCRNLQNGKLIWQFASPLSGTREISQHNGPESTPVIDQERLYALGAEAKLYCLSRAAGDLLWMRDLQTDYQLEPNASPVGSSLLLAEGRLYLHLVGTERSSTVVAFQPQTQTGETDWTAQEEGRSFSAPRWVTWAGQRRLLTLSERFLSSFEPDQGQLQEQFALRSSQNPRRVSLASPLVVQDQGFVIAGSEQGLLGIQMTSERKFVERWRSQLRLNGPHQNLVCVNDWIFGCLSEQQRQPELTCLNLKTGKVHWSWPPPAGPGSLVAADGKLYLLSEQGHLMVLQVHPQQPVVLYQSQQPLLQAPCHAAPVIASGKLLLRDEQKLIAIRLQ